MELATKDMNAAKYMIVQTRLRFYEDGGGGGGFFTFSLCVNWLHTSFMLFWSDLFPCFSLLVTFLCLCLVHLRFPFLCMCKLCTYSYHPHGFTASGSRVLAIRKLWSEVLPVLSLPQTQLFVFPAIHSILNLQVFLQTVSGFFGLENFNLPVSEQDTLAGLHTLSSNRSILLK